MADTFPGVLAFAFMCAMLVFGVVLRAKLSFLQRNVVPASMIGGVMGFVWISSGFSLGFESTDFTAFAFHFFTLSFMSLVLTGSKRESRTSGVARGGMWLSLVWTMSLVLQALVGLGVILIYNFALDDELSVYLGMLATHGFTQGPGQALAFGDIWEHSLGIEHAVNFGLAYASAGFLVAFAVGVPAATWALRRGLHSNKTARLDDEFLSGLWSSQVSSGRQVTHPANVDSLVFHIAILACAYLLTDQYIKLMYPLAASLDLGPIRLDLIFSHNLFFLHGLMICVVLRMLLERLHLSHFIDDETQRRITGSAVDLMVVGTLMSVQFAFVQEYVVPLLLVCLAIALATAALCMMFGRRLAEFGPERALTAFGCCCGSTGSGLLLLRILDPDMRTPVAKELAFFNIAIVFLTLHILMVMAPALPSFSMLTICVVYIGTFIIGAVVLTGFYGQRNASDGA